MKMWRIANCAVILFLCAVGQAVAMDISEASHLIDARSHAYAPIPVSSVQVYLYKPNVPFEIIGTINARGMADGQMAALGGLLSLDLGKAVSGASEEDDQRLAIQALVQEAASIGANGVIIAQQAQVQVSAKATERRIVGIAIRY